MVGTKIELKCAIFVYNVDTDQKSTLPISECGFFFTRREIFRAIRSAVGEALHVFRFSYAFTNWITHFRRGLGLDRTKSKIHRGVLRKRGSDTKKCFKENLIAPYWSLINQSIDWGLIQEQMRDKQPESVQDACWIYACRYHPVQNDHSVPLVDFVRIVSFVRSIDWLKCYTSLFSFFLLFIPLLFCTLILTDFSSWTRPGCSV